MIKEIIGLIAMIGSGYGAFILLKGVQSNIDWIIFSIPLGFYAGIFIGGLVCFLSGLSDKQRGE